MSSLTGVGRAFVVGGLGLAAGADPAQNQYHRLPIHGAVAALAGTVAFMFPSYIIAPTPAPQEGETQDQPPSTTDRCIIPIPVNMLTAHAALDEPECTALQKSLEGGDAMTLNAFRVLGETQGISPENRLEWQEGFTPRSRYFSFDEGPPSMNNIQESDLPKSVMWGIDGQGHPFMAMKYTIDKVHRCVNTFYHEPKQYDGYLLTASDSMDCLFGPLNTQEFIARSGFGSRFPYNQFTNTLQALLKGEEVTSRNEDGHVSKLQLLPQQPEAPAAEATLNVVEQQQPVAVSVESAAAASLATVSEQQQPDPTLAAEKTPV